MLIPRKFSSFQAFLLCSSLILTPALSSDYEEKESSYDEITPWQEIVSSPMQSDDEDFSSSEEDQASLIKEEDLLQLLMGSLNKAVSPTDALIEAIKPYIPYVYKINFHSSLTGESDGHSGTGFLLDAKEGIIATNYHVVPGDLPGLITVVTDNGEEYTTPDVEILQTSVGQQFGDFSILRVKKLATDDPGSQMPIARVFDAKKHDYLGFMGNSYGSFTVEVGGINDRYFYWDSSETRGGMSVSVNLNARGGASGSPVFNVNGEVVGILFAGDDVHNMILPISYVLNAYEQIKSGERVTAVSLGAPLLPEKIHTLSLYHHIPLDKLRNYIAAEDQELKLMVAKPISDSKSEDSLRSNDIVLTIDGEAVGTDQIRMNELLKYSDTHTLEIFRDGELKTIKVPTVTHEQSFVRSIDIDGMLVVSAHSALSERFGVAQNTPLIKISLEEVDIYSIVTKVHKTTVTTFNDFIHTLINVFEEQKLSTFILSTKKIAGNTTSDMKVDLRGALGKSMFVTLMDETEHKWINMDYKEYDALNNPSVVPQPSNEDKKKINLNRTQPEKRSRSQADLSDDFGPQKKRRF